jgi:polyphenol oxidase
MAELWTSFPALAALPGFAHAFTLRHPEIEVAVDRAEALKRLTAWHHEIAAEHGFASSQIATAEQVHGRNVAVVTQGDLPAEPATDALVCATPGVMIGIYVADCCAVYFVDPVSGAFGVAHAGKKGAELNITGEVIKTLQENFGTKPEDLIVQLSPCIRPPVYEVDFAALIRDQARASGVLQENIHDEGTCTSSDPKRFYSYRQEKGKTGRMLALLGRNALRMGSYKPPGVD